MPLGLEQINDYSYGKINLHNLLETNPISLLLSQLFASMLKLFFVRNYF